MTKDDIIQMLKDVHHPGKGDKDIVELGYVEKVEIDGRNLTITLVFPGKRDPLAEYITGSAKAAVFRHTSDFDNVNIVTTVKEEPQARKHAGLEFSLEELTNVRHIIGVASGKGGVGKSTVAVNLAVALARSGYKVGLADADVYGPSIPVMTGTEGAMPEAIKEDGKDIILPIEKFGVKWMSIGYFAKEGQALIWRGPMACNALKQMILQVRWGILDYLLIDMPPGTGDIHISLVQDIPMEGAVIVTTPQTVALADVEKGVDMFRNKNINRKLFGIVENMAWFTPAELPDNKYYIFGKGGGEKMAEKYGIPLLGQIPLVQSIREDGDAGEPAALSTRPDGMAFVNLAQKLVKSVDLP